MALTADCNEDTAGRFARRSRADRCSTSARASQSPARNAGVCVAQDELGAECGAAGHVFQHTRRPGSDTVLLSFTAVQRYHVDANPLANVLWQALGDAGQAS